MPANIPKYALWPHSFEQLAHPVQHIAGARRAPAHFVCCVCGRPPGARPFRMLCFLCRDSLRGKSLMNLDCRFVVVWPQRQTFVRLLLQLQNRSLLRADVRRSLLDSLLDSLLASLLSTRLSACLSTRLSTRLSISTRLSTRLCNRTPPHVGPHTSGEKRNIEYRKNVGKAPASGAATAASQPPPLG